jgi:hypothetical protein
LLINSDGTEDTIASGRCVIPGASWFVGNVYNVKTQVRRLDELLYPPAALAQRQL